MCFLYPRAIPNTPLVSDADAADSALSGGPEATTWALTLISLSDWLMWLLTVLRRSYASPEEGALGSCGPCYPQAVTINDTSTVITHPNAHLTLRWEKSPTVEHRRGLAADPVYMAADFVGPTVVRVCGVEYPIGRKRRVEVVGRVDPDVAKMLLDESVEITKVVLHPEPGSSIKIRILER
jgi:hypothetical protein